MVQLANKESQGNMENNQNQTTKFKSQAKQRASIKWLLSKAYNHKIPEELAEPFYKNHEGEEHLKPHIVKGLSDAELYCLALCNLYADPNYSQLSPWGVVQALARKGVYVQSIPEMQLTETVLIQNRPLRMVAHMAVLEALMNLQVKEIISADRMVNTVQRYGPAVHPHKVWLGAGDMPSDHEEAFILWINRSIIAIKEYIQNNNSREHNLSSNQVENWNQLALFQDLSDLSDGIGLCALFAFYLQDEISLSEITLPNPGERLSVSNSLWNLQLVERVCRDSLPNNVCHFNYEDILYYNDSMKQNMLSFLADLFNLVELNPGSNVKLLGSHSRQPLPTRPGLTGEGVRMRRGFTHQSQISTTIPDLRPSLYTCPPASSTLNTAERNALRSQSATSTPKRHNLISQELREKNRKSSTSIYLGDERKSPTNSTVLSIPVRRSGTPQDYDGHSVSDKSNNKEQRYYANSRSSEDSDEFVVHRGRNVPTLSQVIRSVSPSSQDERSSPGSRMTRNISMDGEDPSVPAAGRPSNLGANKTSYAGRRSRRNSFSEADSQLTVENFGGSQDNLNRFVIGKNPDKQPAVLTDEVSNVRYPIKHFNVDGPELYNRQESDSSAKSDREANRSLAQQRDQEIFHGKKNIGYEMEDNPREESSSRYERGRDPERSHYPSENSQQQRPQEQQQQSSSFRLNRQEQQQQPVTVYMMNNDGGNMGGFGDPPLRSTSLTNLSRLSDLQNKPINIVYLQSATNGGGSGNQSYAGSEYGDRDRSSRLSQSQEYRTMTIPGNSSSNPNPRPQQQHQPQPPQHSAHSQIRSSHQQQYRSPSPQSSHSSPHSQYAPSNEDVEDDTDELAAQLANIRLKLEEKRKRIEMEKGRIESVASKNQFKLGKAAYLKAINKEETKGGNIMGDSLNVGTLSKTRPITLKDLESKWLNKTEEPCRTPEIESMDMETYQKSLAKMDTSLTELESDIGRLTAQQEQIQRQFFLHGDEDASAKRKTWTVPAASSGGSRTYWSPPKFTKEDSPQQSYWDQPSPAHRQQYNGETRAAPSIFTPKPSQTPIKQINNFSGSNGGFRLHTNADSQGNRLFSRQGGEDGLEKEDERPTPPPRQRTIHQAPLPTPPPDDMEPQSVSFVQEDNPPSSTELASIGSSRKSINITSGSKTYRITPESGSPPRPSAHRLFNSDVTEHSLPTSDENASLGERGFYIPLESDSPLRPKPPLRTKSPTKRTSMHSYDTTTTNARRDLSSEYVHSIVDRVPIHSGFDEPDAERYRRHSDDQGKPYGIGQKPSGELVIDEKHALDSNALDQMEKKKERILLQSLKRQQATEDARRVKEMELLRRKEEESMKAEEKFRKKEDEKARKQAILELYRIKKSEDMEKDGKTWEVQENTKRFLRPKSGPAASGPRQRPKTIHLTQVDSGASSYGQRVGSGMLRRSDSQTSSTALGRTSTTGLYSGMDAGQSTSGSRNSVRDPWGSTTSLNQDNQRRGMDMYGRRSRSRPRELSTSRLEVRGRHHNYMGSQDYLPARGNSTSSLLDGPGSLPPGLMSRRSRFDDGASDISSVNSSNMDYSGLRLYKQPTVKSNRGIIMNAVEYCVFPGVVNRENKLRVLDEVNRSESTHFLLMFRDAGCQYRALYTYVPETDEIIKLHGVGPKQVNDSMFEKFFKYNSGGKCFSQVHTKHLTVTIDAFTIHNALWQGKKAPAAKTKDMALVI